MRKAQCNDTETNVALLGLQRIGTCYDGSSRCSDIVYQQYMFIDELFCMRSLKQLFDILQSFPSVKMRLALFEMQSSYSIFDHR
jgi:hypothetical protein